MYQRLEKQGLRPKHANPVKDIGPELDEAKLNAYFERVKTRD